MRAKIVMFLCDKEGAVIGDSWATFNSIKQASEITGIGSSSITRNIKNELVKVSGKGKDKGKYFKFYNALNNNPLEDGDHTERYTIIRTKTDDGDQITKRYDNLKFVKTVSKKDIQNVVNKEWEAIFEGINSKKRIKKHKSIDGQSTTCLMPIISDLHLENENDLRRLSEIINWIIDIVKKEKTELLVLTLLGDFWHVDNLEGTTTAGTRVANEKEKYEILINASQLLKFLVRSTKCKIHFVICPGNHDRNRLTATRLNLEEKYWLDQRITFNEIGQEFKKFTFGKYDHYFTHGDKNYGRIPNVIANFNKELKDASGRVFVHTGHFHFLKMIDVSGGTWIQHPSSAKQSDYEEERGYLDSNRQVIMFGLDKKKGITRNFIFSCRKD